MDTFKLPNGFVHKDKLYNILELEELTGKQQNYLINTKYKSHIQHIQPILNDLVVDIKSEDGESLLSEIKKEDIILKTLPIEDIQFILVKLREISYGSQYYFDKAQCKCPHCEKSGNYKLELDSLEIIQ